MLYDTHIHTEFSHDSNMLLQDAASKACELGIGIIITEHVDLNYPDPLAFRINTHDYFKTYAPYRHDALLLGVEIGLSLGEVADNKRIVADNPFDYVIGSIHLVNDVDTYAEVYYKGKSKQQAYEEYFDAMHACIHAYDFIDSLGHIDYICRYARYADQELYYSEFSERLEAILAALAGKDKCLELNTRRIGNKQAAECLLTLYKRFKELGGKYVTIGSDAHFAADIGKNFSAALEITDRSGLKPVWFRERQMQYTK